MLKKDPTFKRKRLKGNLSGKTRFRAAVRQVISNRSWLADDVMPIHVDAVIKGHVMKIDDISREKYQSLTLANKAMLRKDGKFRTPEDIEHLYKVIGHFKCFRRYPENVRKELVATTYFEYFGPDRVIVRQNHESTFMAFVLRGELELTCTTMNPVLGELETSVVSHLMPGDVFGEVSLLHNIPRIQTVTSITAVELLILKKDDFERVLKASMKKQWDDINLALKQFPYFDSWDEVAIRECCMLSDTVSYTAQNIILGKGYGKLTSAHFVLSGNCSLIQRLKVKKEESSYKLLPSHTPVGPDVEFVFMQVCLVIKGGCFNIGEPLDDRTIVADTDVRLLRIPLYMLRQHNVANIWHRIRQFIESRMTSEEVLFRSFLEARRWSSYKKDLCWKLRNPNTLNHTSIHDAPYYWRVLHEGGGIKHTHQPTRESHWKSAGSILGRRSSKTSLRYQKPS